MAATVSFPVVNMEKLETEEKATAMEIIRDACENWGFFEVCIYSRFVLWYLAYKLISQRIVFFSHTKPAKSIFNHDL